MEIIDIHAHVFRKVAGFADNEPMSSLSYGQVSVGNRKMQLMPPSFMDSASPAECLLAHMDDCDVGKALLMSNPFYGYHNDYLRECTLRYKDRLKGIALVDVLKGRKAADELEKIYEEGILSGLKFEIERSFQFAPDTRLTDKLLEPLFDCMEAYEQPVFIHMLRKCDIGDVKTLAERYPKMVMVLCHLGADACFKTDDGAFEELLDIMRERPQLYCDTSTVPEYFQEEYPFPSAVFHIRKMYNAIGPERLLWASDYPGMLKMGTYRQLINIVINGCADIPAEHKEQMMGANAKRLFFG